MALLASFVPFITKPTLKIKRTGRISKKFCRLIPGGRGKPVYQPFPMQQAIHSSEALYRVACLGRQVGKSELAAAEATFELCNHPHSEGWVVAPVFEQAEVIFLRTLEKVVDAASKPEFAHLRVRSKKGSRLEITVEHYDRNWQDPHARLVGTAKFKGKSGKEPDNLVGATLTYLIIDEAAVLDERAWTQALEPMLSTTQGWVLFVSTPRGFNWFYEIYMRGQSESGEDVAWESFNAPSWDANPTVPRSWYEDKKTKTPDLEFRQEYGAEFVSNSGSVFQGVDSCPKVKVDPLMSDYQTEQLISRPVNPGSTYVIGADFARLQDYTVYTVLDLNTHEMVASYRYSNVDWDQQLASLKAVSDNWNGALVVGDNNGVGDYVELECSKLGIPFEGLKFTGSQIKSQVMNHLAIGLEQGYLAIQDDPQLIKELRLYKYSRTDSGQLKMAAEGRGHDDRVVSLALAYSRFEHSGEIELVSRHDQLLLNSFDELQEDFAELIALNSGSDGDVFGVGVYSESDSLGALGDLDSLNAALLR